MRGRSPVTVWRPPARAHTLAHTQSNCRVDGSAAWALRAGCPAPRWYIAHCVLQSVLSFTRLRIVPRRPAAARGPGCSARAGAARGARARHTTPARDRAPRRLGRRPARRDKFRGLRVFRPVSGFPGTSVVQRRPTWTSARPTPRTRKASLRLVARRAAVRQPARSPESGVFGSTLGSPTGVSLSPSRFTDWRPRTVT